MVLCELSVLSLLALAPQDPGVPPAEALAATNADLVAAERDLLRRAEAAGAAAEFVVVAGLLGSTDAAVAGRAAWLLGNHKVRDAVPSLCTTATRHDAPEVRLQAMAALQRIGDPRASDAAIAALQDDDARLRTLAAQCLARLRTDDASAALLVGLQRFAATSREPTAADIVAMLVALHDLGDPKALLPAATSIETAAAQARGKVAAPVDHALAFLFQELSPRLPAHDEATLLVAVLAHPAPLLRRYAIQRLGELKDGSTALALERRLAAEGHELQPLLRVSLAQVRGEPLLQHDDLWTRGQQNAAALLTLARTRWQALDQQTQLLWMGGSAVGGILLVALLWVWQRRRAAAAHELAGIEAAALVAPSPDMELMESLNAADADGDPVAATAGEQDPTAILDVDSGPVWQAEEGNLEADAWSTEDAATGEPADTEAWDAATVVDGDALGDADADADADRR